MTKFNKKPTTLSQQVEILKSRGVRIDNASAERLLLGINYYRFCGYGLFFEKFGDQGERLDQFKEGTSFNSVYQLYLWDESLRSLLQKYLGKIEVAFRAVLNYELVTNTQNSHWYLDSSIMVPTFDRATIETECSEAMDRAVNDMELSASHFRSAYDEEKYPPCWIISEFFSFGKWSKIFGQLKCKDHKKIVAKFFKAPPDDFTSWMRALVILRNRCAHHARLWNYEFKIKPSQTMAMKRLNINNGRIGIFAYILHDLLSFSPSDKECFRNDFNNLLLDCPQPYTSALGIPAGFTLK